MEGSAVVEENHQRSDSTPISKSSESLIRIDAISIDLAGAIANHHEAKKCDIFSIRGYAAEMRKKDISICFPFAFDDNQNKSEEQTSILPPLHVAKFRWWRCQNCQREIGTTSAAEEIGIDPDGSQTGFISNSTCSHIQSPNDAVMMLSNSQQAPELDNFAETKIVVNTSTNVNRDETHLSSCNYNKEKKDEVGHAAVVGYENGAGDDVNQEICNPTYDMTESNPCFQERHAEDPDAFGSKSSSLVEFCGPSCGSHAAADIKDLERIGGSSAEICQTGTLTSVGGEQRIVSMACETPKVVGKIKKGINFVKGQTDTLPSLDLEEHDNLSSESDEVLAENNHHDRYIDNSNRLARQKTQKLRLLSELLGSKGKTENDHIRTEGGPSSVVSNISAGLNSVSDLCGHMAVQGSLKKRFGGPKGKRKMPQDKDWKALEMSRPSKLTKTSRVFKGDAVIRNMNIVIADSESEEDGSARVDLEAGIKSQWTQHRMDRNLMPSKKKNRKTQLEVGYSPLMPEQEVVPKTNHVQFGDAEEHCAAADGGFSKLANDAFINSRIEPYFRSSLPPQQTERKSSLCKKKNKQVGAEHACLMPQRNSVLGQGSIMRKDSDIMETEPETVKLQSAHDATARKGLDLSLNSYIIAQRNEKSRIAQTGDGADRLFPQLKGTSREDHHQRKNIMHVGDSSVSRKSAPDPIFRKGLLCDLNEKIAENGSFSSLQQLDFSGTPNSENAIEVHEQGSDDIPMEIVELLARNQYERCRHEAERNYFFSEKTNGKRNAELMGFPRVQGNGVLKSLQEENHPMRKPLSGMGMVTIGENGGPFQQNSSHSFSEIHGSHLNRGQLEGNSAFAGFSAFSRCQEMQSGGVQKSDSGSIRNSNSQNCNWKGDKMASRFTPTKIPALVYNSCRNGPRQSEAAEHVRSSLIPNHMPFGPSVPQKYANQSRNFEMHSQFPATPCEGRMFGELDLNLVSPNANNLEKQTSNFDSESFRRASAEYPFVCKHRGIDLNAKASGSLDAHSNETIPAMQLLSLMDAGMQSSSAFSLDGKPKFFTKPFFPCDHHPKVSFDGSSKILEKPLFPYHHHSKEPSGRGTRVYYDSSRHPSSAFYGKNHPSEKSCECLPAVPAVGSFASPLQNEGNFKRGTVCRGRVSSKSVEQGKALMQNRGCRSQKSVCTSGISRTLCDSNPIQDKQKGFSGASDIMVLPLQRHTTEGSTKFIDLGGSFMNGTIFPLRSISKNDICSVNRNPADFTIPEAGNVYMISSKDLKFGKKISSKGRSGLINVDGRKRKRVPKLAAMKGHSQPHSS